MEDVRGQRDGLGRDSNVFWVGGARGTRWHLRDSEQSTHRDYCAVSTSENGPRTI